MFVIYKEEMNGKIKTSLITLAIITAISIIKLVFFYFSNSFAVLSEVWHSFSDVGTTLLVLISIFLHEKKKKFFNINFETVASVIISTALIFVSFSILYNATMLKGNYIKNPLITGIVFIALSFGSYFIYRFESASGQELDSDALKADSLHNRADMIISLLTGFSLVLYHIGVNIDKYIGILIALFILSFSIEMLINSIIKIVKKKEVNITSSQIVLSLFKEKTYVKLFKLMKLEKFTGNMKKVFKWTVRTAVAAGIIAYLSTSILTVSTQQEAFRLRFGKIVNRDTTLKPGIHLKWTWPFEEVVKVNVKHIYSLYLGNQSNSDLSKIWALEHGDNLEFISGDNNLFLPYVTVHYQNSDPYLFYLSNEDSTEFLRQLSLQNLTKTFVTTPFYDLMLFKKKDWLKKAQDSVQKELNKNKTGLKVVSFLLEDIHPPTVVASSYERIVAAYQQKETMLNLAELAKNKMLPDFRAEAQKIENEAHSFAVTEINKKEGEARNYLLRQEAFDKSKGIVSRIMKMEAATEILEEKPKIIIDKRTNISRDMIYFENFINKDKGRR